MAQEVHNSQIMAEPKPEPTPAAPAKKSYRSFKKKYGKLKVKFTLQMKESEQLIREELRIEDLSKRIQEQNDQLLEVLLEFNDSVHVPSNLRFDLSAPGDSSFLPYSENVIPPMYSDATEAKIALESARSEMMAGRITPEAYRNLEDAAKRGRAFAPERQYTSLTNVPHTVPTQEDPGRLEDTEFENKLGFLTPEHETQFYLNADAKLGDESAALRLGNAPGKPSQLDRDRETTLRNPASVYNWLRKNQPHIFLQDNENASEKSGARPSNVRSSKRATAQVRKDEDTHDEDGSFVDAGASGGSKGKRKRDEDASYKPKGGGGRSRKKKDSRVSGGNNNTPKKHLDSGA